MFEAHPMNGGDGLNSYVQNSTYQKGVIDAAKEVIFQAASEKLDIIPSYDPSRPICIADLGCSTGPNTFSVVEIIIEAIELNYRKTTPPQTKCPNIQVFFSDLVDNDFNILFKTLPPSRRYFAAGVPGSFYNQLFPEASLHFVHCSYALHWLSRVPSEILDKRSPAFNRGRIHYTGSEAEVVKAYYDQFVRDMGSYFRARAAELVDGGLVVIEMPYLPNGEVMSTRTGAGLLNALLGSSLMDLVKMGVIREENVDSFNLPQYYPSTEELETVIMMTNCFIIEKIGTLTHPWKNLPFDVQATSAQERAIFEGIFTEHFGHEIMDQLFKIFTKKLQENYNVFDKEIRKDCDVCLVLKRKLRK